MEAKFEKHESELKVSQVCSKQVQKLLCCSVCTETHCPCVLLLFGENKEVIDFLCSLVKMNSDRKRHLLFGFDTRWWMLFLFFICSHGLVVLFLGLHFSVVSLARGLKSTRGLDPCAASEARFCSPSLVHSPTFAFFVHHYWSIHLRLLVPSVWLTQCVRWFAMYTTSLLPLFQTQSLVWVILLCCWKYIVDVCHQQVLLTVRERSSFSETTYFENRTVVTTAVIPPIVHFGMEDGSTGNARSPACGGRVDQRYTCFRAPSSTTSRAILQRVESGYFGRRRDDVIFRPRVNKTLHSFQEKSSTNKYRTDQSSIDDAKSY